MKSELTDVNVIQAHLIKGTLAGLIIFSFACLAPAGLYAQKNMLTHLTSYEKRGDKMFYFFAYSTALESYQSALRVDPEKDHLKLKIAECYRMLNNPIESEKWYGQAMANDKVVKPEHRLHYAQALISNGKYEEARKWLEVYRADVQTDSRSLKKIEVLNNLTLLLRDSLSCLVNPLNVNARESDFSPALYKEGIVFVSARPQNKVVKTVFAWNQTQFLDLYYSEESENGNNNAPVLFHKNVNTSLHEGPTVFYDGGNKMIFTRNNLLNGKKGESKDGIVKLKLYSSFRQNDEWSKPVSLPFNHDEYSVGHPAITSNGKTLYFASDMPGGLGGTDIYKSEWNGTDWGKPVNLGNDVNTEGNEMFPFIYRDQDLYFASNGHGGLGGLDVFVASLADLKSQNLGAPINSSVDDFGLVVHTDGFSGYFSSNRTGSAGDDDLYHFAYVLKQIELIAYDLETGALLSACSVQLMDGNREAGFTATGHKGSAILGVNPKRNYTVFVQRDGYVPAKGALDNSLMQQPDFNTIRIPLQRMSEIDSISAPDSLLTVLDFDDNGEGSPNDGDKDRGGDGSSLNVVTIYQLVNVSGAVQEIAIVNNKPFVLDEANRNLIDQSEKIFATFSGRLPGQLDVRKAILISEFEKKGLTANFIEIRNIYYDYDMDFIRNDASSDLDKLVHLLLDFPELKILLGSHTDSRGSNAYNEDLASRRALSGRDYLINEGVPESQIAQSGFGETKLVNDCGDGIICDENNHQLNRRTEVIIAFKSGITINGK